MDFKKKEAQFRALSNKIKSNKKLISVFKTTVPVLMLVFILTSFISLYLKSSVSIEKNVYLLFYTILVISFALMIGANFFIKKREKENKQLDTAIYNLMKLKI